MRFDKYDNPDSYSRAMLSIHGTARAAYRRANYDSTTAEQRKQDRLARARLYYPTLSEQDALDRLADDDTARND